MLRRLLAVLLLVSSSGCADDYYTERDLTRDRNRLEQQQQLLRAQIAQITAGKTTFTEQEKAILGPLWVELRQVEGELDDVNRKSAGHE